MRISLAAGALAALGLCFGFSANANAQCVTGGGGGVIPASGTGDGVWPGTLPTFPMVSTLNVTVPSGATVLNSVKLNGLSHTWVGDVQVVLQNPAGAEFNIFHRLQSVAGSVGCSGDLAGDFQFFDPIAGSNPCGAGPIAMPCGTTIPGGSYLQSFGDWPSGAISNTALEQIPISSGVWTLKIYDWVGGDIGALTSFDLCFGSPTVPGGPGGIWNCVTGGAGGAIPGTGAVDGTWPLVLPTGQLSSTLAVTVPSGATQITAVKLNGLSHTWNGDCHIVLTSPAGVNYNIFQQVDGVFGGGCADDFNGDYAFVDPVVGTNECGGPAGVYSCGVGSLPPGAYGQFYGAWNSGDAGIVNVNMSSIPVASGNWTLSIYDWYVLADGGSLASWDLCFDASSGPTAYCTSGTSTNGCLPSISATTQPNLANNAGCVISCANVEGQKLGLFFYGVNNTGFSPVAWGTGTSFLCVKGPTQRTPSASSGGTFGACDGTLSVNWDAFQAANPGSLGNPFSAGDSIFVQTWYRDPPSPKTTNLSDALEMTVQP